MGVSSQGLTGLSPVKGYRLFRTIAHWPGLLPQMRAAFLDVLLERGVITRQGLAAMAAEQMGVDGAADTEENRA
jgi:hypothetical protein